MAAPTIEHPVRSTRPDPPRRRRGLTFRQRLGRDKLLLAFAAPGLLIILAFPWYALCCTAIAFQDCQPFLGIERSLWVGFENLSISFNGDAEFLNALKNTLIITALQSIFVCSAPIVLSSL